MAIIQGLKDPILIVATCGVMLITALLVRRSFDTAVAAETETTQVEKEEDTKSKKKQRMVPISVNYHFTRKCNYKCGFCFHTAKTSHVLTVEEAKIGLSKLKAAGMRKINFAGGEPFLYPKFLGELVAFCKESLALESVSIISNASKITEEWMRENAKHLDILGVSCDSFDEETNVKIGRGAGKHIGQIFRVRDLCEQYNVKFKLNTVVCKHNWDEDMNEAVTRLRPFRWKCFQVSFAWFYLTQPTRCKS
jgi:radical S-adenosyl methionine domain-containing protein 2